MILLFLKEHGGEAGFVRSLGGLVALIECRALRALSHTLEVLLLLLRCNLQIERSLLKAILKEPKGRCL